MIDIGSAGSEVKELQSILADLGYSIEESEHTDGYFGESTDAAVRRFQTLTNLEVDGMVGRNTLSMLQAELRKIEAQSEAVEDSVISLSDFEAVLIKCKVPPQSAMEWSQPLYQAMEWGEILDSKYQVSSFTANVLHETGYLKTFEENLNYSVNALRSQWGKRFTQEDANKYGRTASQAANQRMIANLAYGSRNGNRGVNTSDGWDFRGRGPFQLTFLGNYQAFSEDSDIDVVSNPSLVAEDPLVGSLAAAWFWKTNRCDVHADKQNFNKVREIINGGTNGLDEVNRMTNYILSLI